MNVGGVTSPPAVPRVSVNRAGAVYVGVLGAAGGMGGAGGTGGGGVSVPSVITNVFEAAVHVIVDGTVNGAGPPANVSVAPPVT